MPLAVGAGGQHAEALAFEEVIVQPVEVEDDVPNVVVHRRGQAHVGDDPRCRASRRDRDSWGCPRDSSAGASSSGRHSTMHPGDPTRRGGRSEPSPADILPSVIRPLPGVPPRLAERQEARGRLRAARWTPGSGPSSCSFAAGTTEMSRPPAGLLVPFHKGSKSIVEDTLPLSATNRAKSRTFWGNAVDAARRVSKRYYVSRSSSPKNIEFAAAFAKLVEHLPLFIRRLAVKLDLQSL